MSQALDETVHTVRRISTELRSGFWTTWGLAAAIEWQARDFQARFGRGVHGEGARGGLQLSRSQTTSLFRIFQESLTNVARHAQAQRLRYSATRVENHAAEGSHLARRSRSRL
jgi:signal transduction histidine kinase